MHRKPGLPMFPAMLSAIRQNVPLESRVTLLHQSAISADLRADIESQFWKAVQQTKSIAHRFEGSNVRESARNVHEFARKNFLYLKDDPHNQKIKLPSVLLRHLYADCKSFNGTFTAPILFCLGYPVALKYVSYGATPEKPNPYVPSHIYATVTDESGNEICVDATDPEFDNESPYFFSIIKNMNMKVYALSGLTDQILAGRETLSQEAAENFFSVMCAMSPEQRKKFLAQFNRTNQEKLLRSLRSVVKNADLDQMETSFTRNPSAYVFTNPGEFFANYTGSWQTWSNLQNSPYAYSGKWNPGYTWNYLKENISGKKYANKNPSEEILADEVLAGKVGDKILSFINKVNPLMAIGRGAVLALTRLNVRGLAVSVRRLIDKMKDGELKERWEKIGGKWERLRNASTEGSEDYFNELKAVNEIKSQQEQQRRLEEIKNEAAIFFDIPVSQLTPGQIQQFMTAKKKSKIQGGIGDISLAAAAAAAAPVLGAIIPIIKKLTKEISPTTSTLDLDTIAAGANKLVDDGTANEFLDKAGVWLSDKFSGIKNAVEEITEPEIEDLEDNYETYAVEVSEADTQKKRDKITGKLNPDSPNYDEDLVKKYEEGTSAGGSGLLLLLGAALLMGKKR